MSCRTNVFVIRYGALALCPEFLAGVGRLMNDMKTSSCFSCSVTPATCRLSWCRGVCCLSKSSIALVLDSSLSHGGIEAMTVSPKRVLERENWTLTAINTNTIPILGITAHCTISCALWCNGKRIMRISNWRVYIIALSTMMRMTPRRSRGELLVTPSTVEARCCRHILNAIIPVVMVFCANANG